MNKRNEIDDRVGVFSCVTRGNTMPDLEREEDRRFGRNDIYRHMAKLTAAK